MNFMADVNWLSNSEQKAWRAFLRGHALILDAVNHDIIKDADLQLHEYEVLVRLSESPEHTLRMSSLAENLVHSRSRLTHTVSRLESQGYVERYRCAEDRRGIRCRLTESGFEKLKNAAPDHVRSVREHFVDRLSAEEFAVLGEIFGKLIEDSTTS